LDELYESQRAIDRDKYPERAEEIDLEISERIKDPAFKEELDKKNEINKYSTFIPRFFASIIDGIVISIISASLVFLGSKLGGNGQVVFEYIDAVQFVVYSVTLHAIYGQTLGKMALEVKVVDCITEKNISTKQAMLRDCVPIAMIVLGILTSISIQLTGTNQVPDWLLYGTLVFTASFSIWHLLEIVTMLFNEKRRALHDFIAGTVVVRI